MFLKSLNVFLNRVRDSLKWRLKPVFKYVCSILPIQKNKIIFNCYSGRAYADSQKYIANEILRQNLPFQLVWLVKDNNVNIPGRIKKVRIGSYRALYELSTARVIINNVKILLYFRKRKSQYYIQTWHAGFSTKLLENDAIGKLGEDYVKQSIQESAITDLYVSNSRLQSQDFLKAFWYNGEILECGYPRNDIFFNCTKDDKKLIREKIGISPSSTFLLYAPTFRDNGDMSCYSINYEDLQQSLCDAGYKVPRIGVRLHPNIAYNKKMEHSDFVIDLSQYPDMQELLLVADILITDYSTTMFEFAMMNKLVILYSPDLQEYKTMRGLKPIYDELPFPMARNQEELYDIILKQNIKEYKNRVAEFMRDIYGNFDDGNGAKTVVNRIKQVIRI